MNFSLRLDRSGFDARRPFLLLVDNDDVDVAVWLGVALMACGACFFTVLTKALCDASISLMRWLLLLLALAPGRVEGTLAVDCCDCGC